MDGDIVRDAIIAFTIIAAVLGLIVGGAIVGLFVWLT